MLITSEHKNERSSLAALPCVTRFTKQFFTGIDNCTKWLISHKELCFYVVCTAGSLTNIVNRNYKRVIHFTLFEVKYIFHQSTAQTNCFTFLLCHTHTCNIVYKMGCHWRRWNLLFSNSLTIIVPNGEFDDMLFRNAIIMLWNSCSSSFFLVLLYI